LQRRGRRGRRRSGRPRGEQVEAKESKETAEPSAEQPIDASAPASAAPVGQLSIADLLSKGREILVQIAKEPLGRKGARITSYIALPGRYLVYMPTVEHVGVSRKIASDGERSRLRTIVQTHRTGMPGGFIARTAGEGASEEEVRGDMMFLYNLWLDIREKAEKRGSPGLIHQDLDIVERILRDQFSDDFKNIWVDGEEEYERILRFVERFQPRLLSRVKLYTRTKPIFDEFNITQEIEKALRPKVWLKSGGYIVINQTEALVAIDVNTGKYVGKSDRLEDTIVNTNLEAAKEIVRQVRLRDLGGIIVVDFIDMDDRKNRQKVMVALDQELRTDSAPSKALQFNDFGLIAITRKRVKQSLERALCSPCPYCHGSGNVKSVQTVTHEILEEARKVATTIEERQKDMTLRVNPEIARFLKARDNTYLQEIEDTLRTHVLVRSDQSLHREHFDIN
jgi:ribonuclease G